MWLNSLIMVQKSTNFKNIENSRNDQPVKMEGKKEAKTQSLIQQRYHSVELPLFVDTN